MKRLTVLVLSFILILGMSTTAMAISDGTYDYYGTMWLDVRDADGDATCSFEAYDMSCPQGAIFCITGLTVETSGGVQTITGPATGIEIETIPGPGLVPDMVHVGIEGEQVELTVGSTGDDVTTTLVVGEMEGGCGPARCLTSWSSTSPSSSGPPGSVVTGTIPIKSATRQESDKKCDGSTFTYPPIPDFTTETATASVTNPENGTTTYSTTDAEITGGLSGSNLTMSTADASMPPLPILSVDVIVVTTFEGTLCDASGGTCAVCPE